MIERSKLFNDDLPKHSPWDDDSLGYAVLSARIARTVIEMDAPNGYVIGLHGKWGSGKSTIMNFTTSYIDKHNVENENDSINIIDYRPLIVSGHQDLVSVFFRVLAEKLGPEDGYWKRFGKRVLGILRGTTDNVIDTASTIARTVDPSGGLASGFAGGMLKKLINWLSLDPAPSLQKSYDVPKPRNNSLFLMLDSAIKDGIETIEDSAGWQYIVRDGIHRWMASPRDVVRFANALKFTLASLHGMLDARDIVAMEGLRIFDVKAYEWLRENRDFLFNQGRFVMASEDSKKSAVQQLQGALVRSTEGQVMRILSVLFPQSTKHFEAGQYSVSEPFDEVIKRRGIGCEAGYDTYFGMTQSSDAIPSLVLNDFVTNLHDEMKLTEIINSYVGKENSRREPMINELLDELRVRFKSSQRLQPTQALLNALVLTGDNIIAIEWEGGFLEFRPGARLGFLLRNILEAWGVNIAGERLISAFERAETPFFIADVYVDRGRELGIFETSSSERSVITNEDFDRLGLILTRKITKASKDGSLETVPFFFDLVRAWKHNTASSEVHEWLEAGMLKSPEFMAKVGRGLLSYSVGPRQRHYTMRDDPDRTLYDLRLLVEAGARHLRNDDLFEDDRKIITEIVRGSEAILKREEV